MSDVDLLLLRLPSYSGQISDFFRRIEEEPSLKEIFISNPVGTLQELVLPTSVQLPPDVLSRENRLLFSLLGNIGFREWANQYQLDFQKRAIEAYPDLSSEEAIKILIAKTPREEFYENATSAALQFIDKDILYSLIDAKSKEVYTSNKTPGSSPTELPMVYLIVMVLLIVAAVYSVIPVNGLASHGIILDGFSREDLKRISGGLLQSLETHAEKLKAEGKLSPSNDSKL